MQTWPIGSIELEPHSPRILTSNEQGRAIAIAIPAGEALTEHQVHERAWVMVVEGEVEVAAGTGQAGEVLGPGSLISFEPGERHELRARSTSRIALLLTPWPGDGHPGAMSLDDKANVRSRAREHDAP